MHLFRSVTPQMARDAYLASATETSKTSLDEQRKKIQGDIEKAQMAYKGGKGAVEMALLKRWNETPTEWISRQNHYRNVPVVRNGVDTMGWLIYGMPPSIEVWIGEKPPSLLGMMAGINEGQPMMQDEDTSALSDFVNMTLEENRNAALMLRTIRQRIRDGISAVKVWGVDAQGVPSLPFETLRMDCHKAGDCIPIYDPDDPDILLAVAEFRSGKWILWTTDTIDYVEPDLTLKESAGEHPIPGVIPFAFLGDGCSLVEDLIGYQNRLINRENLLWAVERACAYPTGVMSGMPGNQEAVAQGAEGLPGQPKSIDIGGGLRYLWFQEADGTFTWVRQDADTAGMRESYSAEMKEAMELGAGIPADSGGLEGTSPEQPTTIVLRWLRAFIRRDALIQEAMAFEDARMYIIAAYGAMYGGDFGLPGYDVDAVDWEVRFPENPLPQDQRAEREQARAEVMADLRPAALYVKEHVLPEADADEIQMAMKMLDAQKNQAMGSGTVNPGTPPPLGQNEQDMNAGQ